MFTSLKRIIKFGALSFYRNTAVTTATVFVMIMVIFLISLMFLFNEAADVLISSIQEKVDISVYFNKEAENEDILSIKERLESMEEVVEVDHVSEEKALERFIERHSEDETLMQSLEEVGENPFLASLGVKAEQASQYASVARLLESEEYSEIVERVDYHQRKPVIDKLFAITSEANKAGLFLGLVLAVLAILVAFNAIRIAIYNSSEEISVMRLVGASNWFVRGPFLIQGFLAGIVAALISFVLMLGILYSLNPEIELMAEISIYSLFVNNLGLILLLQLSTGVGLSVVSSAIAIRKYLEV
jgi:cell division transport system permease protein